MEPTELTLEKLKTNDGVAALNQMFRKIFDNLPGDQDTIKDITGYGTPEGNIAAGVGSTYRRIDGGSLTTLYVKESGIGLTGWVPK